jgi:hypothetical protein
MALNAPPDSGANQRGLNARWREHSAEAPAG